MVEEPKAATCKPVAQKDPTAKSINAKVYSTGREADTTTWLSLVRTNLIGFCPMTDRYLQNCFLFIIYNCSYYLPIQSRFYHRKTFTIYVSWLTLEMKILIDSSFLCGSIVLLNSSRVSYRERNTLGSPSPHDPPHSASFSPHSA